MPRYLFVCKRVTEFEDIIEAETQDEAIEIHDGLLTDDLNITNQYCEHTIYGREVE